MKYLVNLIIFSGLQLCSTSAFALDACDALGIGGADAVVASDTECIRVDDGVVFYDSPGGVLSRESTLAARVTDLDARISEAFGNGPSFNDVAVSNALQSPGLSSGEKAGFRINWGTAGGENAIGVSGALVFAENVFGGGGRLVGTGSVAFSGGQTGGNAGLQISW